MKKTYKLKDLGCANCARKMEEQIGRLEKVQKAKVSFMLQKLTITAEEGDFAEIESEASKIIQRIEPHCSLKFEK